MKKKKFAKHLIRLLGDLEGVRANGAFNPHAEDCPVHDATPTRHYHDDAGERDDDLRYHHLSRADLPVLAAYAQEYRGRYGADVADAELSGGEIATALCSWITDSDTAFSHHELRTLIRAMIIMEQVNDDFERERERDEKLAFKRDIGAEPPEDDAPPVVPTEVRKAPRKPPAPRRARE